MTLTEAAFWTKRVGVILAGLVGIFIIVVIIFSGRGTDPPTPYVTATCACTETKEEFLENKLEIPSLEVNSDSENVFEVQTDTGRIDNLSALEIINVHKYKVKEQRLDAQLKAKEIASALGFEPESIHRKGTTGYVWSNSETRKSLEVNARTLNFQMNTSSSYVREVAKENPLPTENEAISLAKNAVRRLGILESTYNYNEANNIETFLIDINPDGTYSEAASLAEAELIKVDLHKSRPMISIRDDIQNSQAMVNSLNRNLGEPLEDEIVVNDKRITVYNYSTVVTYSNPSDSNISIYVGPEDDNDRLLPQIYRIDFTYWPIEAESCGTYELVSPAYAIDRVQEGAGSLVYLNDINGDEIEPYQPRSVNTYIIYDIAVAYYESREQLNFLQPIYVITGETEFKNGERGEFHIFYPAINYETVTDKVELEETPTEEESGGHLDYSLSNFSLSSNLFSDPSTIETLPSSVIPRKHPPESSVYPVFPAILPNFPIKALVV